MKSKINVILLAIIFSVMLVGSASAVYEDWGYKKQITLSPATPEANYQVKVENPIYNETGLVGNWHFEETAGAVSGTVADSSGLGNIGTLNGFTLPDGVVADGKYDNGMSFDGTGDWVDCEDVMQVGADGDFTIEAWFKTTDATTGHRLLLTYCALLGHVTFLLDISQQGRLR